MTDASPSPSPGLDAYAPAEIAVRVEAAAMAKARLTVLQTLALGMLAGAFIAFGAMAYTLVVTDSTLGFGPTRMLGGVAFSLGLILVVVGGAELFTGNNLLVMAWADRKITTRDLATNWALVYAANLVGAAATAVLAHLAGMFALGDGAVGRTAAEIAVTKVELGFAEAFFRGILCNVLVCLAVWLCFAARDVTGKIFAIIFPIAAFVALGFEHSIANMYAIPAGWLAVLDPAAVAAGAVAPPPGIRPFLTNLIPVTLGNIVGGAGFVALVYYVIYVHPAKR
jgi:formate transporter